MAMACTIHFDCQTSEATTTMNPITTSEKPAKKNDVGFIVIAIFCAIGVFVCLILALIRKKYIW